jgi:hypothetical protein
MPRKSKNTQRGSNVALRKKKAHAKWEAVLGVKAAHPSLSLRSLALRYGVCSRALQARWKRYEAAYAAGDAHAISTASDNHRGGHNRVFTKQQEDLLAAQIKAADPAMTQPQIQDAALSLHRSVRIADGVRELPLRQQREFHASDGFVSAFKKRNRLSSHTMKAKYRSAHRDQLQMEYDALEYVRAARNAVDTYGPEMVMNMDETPVPKVEHPRSGVVETASPHAAPCSTSTNPKLNFTAFACITASGEKLPLSVVLKGKTQVVVRKILRGASAAVHRIRFYTSLKGWINSAIVVKWINEVVGPYTGGRPAALLLDDYAAHWTDDVKAAAGAIQLELIKVPPSQTVEYQPLDVCYHGPMANIRASIWMTQRMLFPDAVETNQGAVERAQLAYDAMSKKAGIDAFAKAYIIDVQD